jgi:hypothetical protein
MIQNSDAIWTYQWTHSKLPTTSYDFMCLLSLTGMNVHARNFMCHIVIMAGC